MEVNLGRRIKELRNERELSQEYVADILGVSRQSVSKWESGQSNPSTANLIALATLFDVPLEALIKQNGNVDDTQKDNIIRKILKVIVFVIIGLCVLHFIIWCIIFAIYSICGESAIGGISGGVTAISMAGVFIYSIGLIVGPLASAGIVITAFMDKNKRDVIIGFAFIGAMFLLRYMPIIYISMEVSY